MKLPLLAFLLLLACGQPESAPDQPDEAKAGEPDNRIECLTGAATGMERVCTVERIATADGLTLVIRKPDGGFRRLRVTDDGTGVEAADGAVPAVVTVTGEGRIDVAIGQERYRLPATIRNAGS